jgi:aryl-alcohol dehydrogenase-like predicted oxidoreductase
MVNSNLGASDVLAQQIPRVGLGCMGMSEFYGAADDRESLRLRRHAHELGYRHFDTADVYGLGANELLLAKFLRQLGQGKIRGAGLSEVSATTLRAAQRVHAVTALQSEYSLWSRDAEHEVLGACEELGVRLVAYSPLAAASLRNNRRARGQKRGICAKICREFRRRITRHAGHSAANLAVQHIRLSPDVLARLDELFRPQALSGPRYPEPLLQTTNA